MATIDEFESQFRRAAKTIYHYKPHSFSRPLYLFDRKDCTAYKNSVETFLINHNAFSDYTLEGLTIDKSCSLLSLCEQVLLKNTDFIISPRLLCYEREEAHSVGGFIDILVQELQIPVLLTPFVEAEGALKFPGSKGTVLTISDNITDDQDLINMGASVLTEGQRLHMLQILDENFFNLMVSVLGKIPSIDTDEAAKEIRAQLIKEASEFEGSCAQILHEHLPTNEITSEVTFAAHITDAMSEIFSLKPDLIILNGTSKSTLCAALISQVTKIPMIVL